MHAVDWSARALRSLDTIGEFIAKDNPQRAISFTHELFRRVDNLARFPYIDPPSEKPDVREFVIHQHYLVSYRISARKVTVLQIWNTAQNRTGIE